MVTKCVMAGMLLVACGGDEKRDAKAELARMGRPGPYQCESVSSTRSFCTDAKEAWYCEKREGEHAACTLAIK